MKTVFHNKKIDILKEDMFFGNDVNVSRFDKQKYPFFEQQTRKQLSFFWVPEEISLESDRNEFMMLNDSTQHIFTANIKRQVILDSLNGRGVSLALLPCVSIPELETFIELWAAIEGPIHSRSYTHIIRNIYNDPSAILDDITEVKELAGSAPDLCKHYDSFIEYCSYYNLLGYGTHTVNGQTIEISKYELFKRLYLMLHTIYILEGIRFYVSFACSWAFADFLKVLKKNAKIIKFIARDENLHMATVNYIIKRLKDGSEGELFKQIALDCAEEVIGMYREAAEQEFAWADYLFKDGSIIGLNADILKDYIKYITNKRVKALNVSKDPANMSPLFEDIGGSNPLPWTEKWIGGRDVQVALQETEATSYSLGGIDRNISEEGKRVLRTMKL